MSIPHDLSLKTTGEGLVLNQLPSIFVTRSLNKYARGKVVEKKNINVNGPGLKLPGKGKRLLD